MGIRFNERAVASGSMAKRSWRAPVALLACALALALAACLVPTTKAAAYFSFGTVGVSLGSSYASLQVGSSTSVSVSISPSSSDQTLGCGMAKCPQVCDTEESLAAGYSCFDANGQCTCSGRSYSTYYPDAYASSSNAGVATAYLSGSTLVVTANGPGSATITVGASLRQYADGAASLQVDVSSPVSSGGSSSGDVGSPAPAPAPSVPSATPSATGVPQAAEAVESKSDELNETVLDTVAGKVILVERNGHEDAPAQLAKIVGTSDQVVFWQGASSEHPDYSWTFVGADLAENAASMPFDPTLSISKLGTGNVSNIMKQAKDGLVLDFAHEGPLPGTASLYVNVDASFADGTKLGLYCYDEDACAFKQVETEVTVEGGYASFKIDHCSSWALSTDDLAAYRLQETNTPGAKAQAERAVQAQDNIADEGSNGWIVPVAVGIVVVAAAVVAAVVLVRRRKRADNGADAAQSGASESGETFVSGAAFDAADKSKATFSDCSGEGDSTGSASVDDATAEVPPVAKDEPDDAR